MTIRSLIRRVQWRDLLVPAGTALLTCGVRYLESRRDAVELELAELAELVTFRRAQLDGGRPLQDEPPTVPHQDEPAAAAGWLPRRRTLVWSLVAGVAIGAVWNRGRLLADELAEQLELAEDVDDEDQVADVYPAHTHAYGRPAERCAICDAPGVSLGQLVDVDAEPLDDLGDVAAAERA